MFIGILLMISKNYKQPPFNKRINLQYIHIMDYHSALTRNELLIRTTLHSRIELGDVTPHNIKQLKRLNQVIFPVSYNDKFYKDVLEVGELAKLAYFNDIAVGAVCCRVDHSQNQKRLYIMTLGCLAPYRRLGIGTKMLNHVLNICEKDGTFDNIYLHVQISNESAIDFYRKFGFEIIETKKNYYKRIEPADAHVLQKNLKVPSGQNADVQKTDN
ncbi:N-alpha-acetyltransferase 50 isoform X1 [Trachypithecus francoisi]|nr:N-alpha-acetyltransferase 50 isoform X1 [Trachypithecus francoisi]